MTWRAVIDRARIAVLVVAFVASCAPHRLVPQAARSPARIAVASTIELEPLDLSPDGEARLLVRMRYTDATGTRVHIPPGGHVDVFASRGEVQWQPRVRYGDPAAIVRLTEAGPLTVRVASDIPHVPQSLTAATDTRAWGLPSMTMRALGPHAVVIGWFPRVQTGNVHIVRVASNGSRSEFDVVAPASSFRDATVTPGAHYTYAVERADGDRIAADVDVPAELPASTIDVMRGKAMWLAFDDVTGWDIDVMLDRAHAAGLRAIELRMSYGEYAEITPERRAVIDRFIDGAALRGIAIVAWTVPRALSFEDLGAGVAAASYRTAAGNGPRGLAVDLERGADFLGSGPAARAALTMYLARLREAVGPHELLVATVEDPQIEALTDADVPYAAIAASADVLQPMVYWRARRAGASIAGMRAELAASYALVRQLSGSGIPIDIGGQTADLGNVMGSPPPAEVAASLVAAQQLGAIGEAFFDWNGTSAAQWAAIGHVAWPSASAWAANVAPSGIGTSESSVARCAIAACLSASGGWHNRCDRYADGRP